MARQTDLEAAGPAPTVIVYFPYPYSGRDLAKSCVRMLEHAPPDVIKPTLLISRLRVPAPARVNAVEADMPILRWIPWRLARPLLLALLAWRFRRLLETSDRDTTIAYFWPDPPIHLLKRAKALGIPIVRQMINSAREEAKLILDDLYLSHGQLPKHGISDRSARREREELALYDYIFCSDQVAEGLRRMGFPDNRLLKTSSAWSPSDFNRPVARAQSSEMTRFLFLGTLCRRKGVLELIQAWEAFNVDGMLRIVGHVDGELRGEIDRLRIKGSVEFLPYSANVGDLYASADVFVLPTYEEGSAKVTYEAAACGLPVITTPMGAGPIIVDGVNGCIVPPGDVNALGAAMAFLAGDPVARRAYGDRAKADAEAFTYDRVARGRALALNAIISGRRSGPKVRPTPINPGVGKKDVSAY